MSSSQLNSARDLSCEGKGEHQLEGDEMNSGFDHPLPTITITAKTARDLSREYKGNYPLYSEEKNSGFGCALPATTTTTTTAKTEADHPLATTTAKAEAAVLPLPTITITTNTDDDQNTSFDHPLPTTATTANTDDDDDDQNIRFDHPFPTTAEDGGTGAAVDQVLVQLANPNDEDDGSVTAGQILVLLVAAHAGHVAVLESKVAELEKCLGAVCASSNARYSSACAESSKTLEASSKARAATPKTQVDGENQHIGFDHPLPTTTAAKTEAVQPLPATAITPSTEAPHHLTTTLITTINEGVGADALEQVLAVFADPNITEDGSITSSQVLVMLFTAHEQHAALLMSNVSILNARIAELEERIPELKARILKPKATLPQPKVPALELKSNAALDRVLAQLANPASSSITVGQALAKHVALHTERVALLEAIITKHKVHIAYLESRIAELEAPSPTLEERVAPINVLEISTYMLMALLVSLIVFLLVLIAFTAFKARIETLEI